MFLKNIRFFLSDLDINISKSFFYLQCSFRLILFDFIKTFFTAKKFLRNFNIIRGNIKIENLSFDFEKDTNQKILYSDLINKNEIDININNIIRSHYNEIRDYIGNDFCHDDLKIYRNYSFPSKFHDYDIYANIWHQDTHDGKRLLKIFVLLHDVEKNDGPLIFLNRFETKKNWHLLKERYRTNNTNSRIDIENQIKFTGKKGDFLIIDTSNCMHRAGIPETTRDMMQITLYPSWMKKKDRSTYKY